MKIIWFSWKDSSHPQAGGAEAVSSQLMERLVNDGHQVRLITAGYSQANNHEDRNGVEIFRTGGRFSVYIKAFWLFRRQMSNWPDLIVDEMNTIPFGCALYSRKPSVLLTYQLARRVWFHQMPPPFSIVGYLLEPVYLFVLSRFYKTVLTESDSTRQDLLRFGFAPKKVHLFRVGTEVAPLAQPLPKKTSHTILVLGAIRPMKQTLDAVKAFEQARDNKPSLELVIAGSNTGGYAKKTAKYCQQSRHHQAIKILGIVSKEEKIKLMRQAALIVVTSVKEGWGLIITEANRQGTPAVAYDNDGLRDSVLANKTGLLVKPGDTVALANAINSLLNNPKKLQDFREAALAFSLQFTYSNSYTDFLKVLGMSPKRQEKQLRS